MCQASFASKAFEKCIHAEGKHTHTKQNTVWYVCKILCCASQVLKNEGTVTAAPNFNASGDAAVLDKAIKVKGELNAATDELGNMPELVWALQQAILKPERPHSIT